MGFRRGAECLCFGLCCIACGASDASTLSSGGGGSGGTNSVGGSGMSSGGTSPGGTAGASLGGNGGSSGGNGGSSATPLRDSCRAYAAAECHRWFECKVIPAEADCAGGSDCPDTTFSPGSTRTPDGMIACASAWASFPCDQVLRGLLPPCATLGTRKPGDACAFSTQCDSGRCYSLTSEQCGACQGLIADGQACDASDTSRSCAAGSLCAAGGAGTVCTPVTPTARSFLLAGDPCTSTCDNGLSCLADSTGSGRCGAAPAAGAACGKSVFGQLVCGSGLGCNASNRCDIAPGAGQPCALGNACDLDSTCNTTMGPAGTCMAKGGPGAPCKSGLGCKSKLECRCAAGTACASQACTIALAEGDACGQPNAQCPGGAQCIAGRCVASDALTTFSDLCPGK